jgi:hypothetical protein
VVGNGFVTFAEEGDSTCLLLADAPGTVKKKNAKVDRAASLSG